MWIDNRITDAHADQAIWRTVFMTGAERLPVVDDVDIRFAASPPLNPPASPPLNPPASPPLNPPASPPLNPPA